MANVKELKEKIESLKTSKGGYTKEALASLGVTWPPQKGWKKRLLSEAEKNES